MATERISRAQQNFNARVLATLFLFGVGLYYALGGSGYDSIASGVMAIGLGVVNFSLGIGGSARIPIFCAGGGLFGLGLLYWAAKVVLELKAGFDWITTP